MKILSFIGLLATGVAACVETTPDDVFLAQIAAVGPNSQQTEIILKRYPAIKPGQVEVHFGYSWDCANLQDVGVLLGWGEKGQTQQEIINDFQIRAAKYGANLVVYEGSIGSVEEMDEILHRRAEYSLMRCP